MKNKIILDCSCQNNSITCHHKGSILSNASCIELKVIGTSQKSHCTESFALTVPPPQPETYTTHLAVLRNLKHPEWTSRPTYYLSPALSNVSPIYVKRIIEPKAREIGGYGAAFTLGLAQSREWKRQKQETSEYKVRQVQLAMELANKAARAARKAKKQQEEEERIKQEEEVKKQEEEEEKQREEEAEQQRKEEAEQQRAEKQKLEDEKKKQQEETRMQEEENKKESEQKRKQDKRKKQRSQKKRKAEYQRRPLGVSIQSLTCCLGTGESSSEQEEERGLLQNIETF